MLRDDTQAVTADDGQITLNLLPVVHAVLARIAAASPEILGRQVDLPEVTVEDAPEAAISRIEGALGVDLEDDFGQFTVYDDGTLSAVQDAISLFDRLVVLLPPLGILLAALAVGVSRRRRRSLLQLCAGLALGMVLIRRVGFRMQDEVAALPPRPQGRQSAALATETFLDPLTTFGAWVLAGALVVAAVTVSTADYPWVLTLRHRAALLWGQAVTTTDPARDEVTTAWAAEHPDVLLAAGGIAGLAVLWFADLSWLGLLMVLAVTGAYLLAVHRIGVSRSAPGIPAADPRSPSPHIATAAAATRGEAPAELDRLPGRIGGEVQVSRAVGHATDPSDRPRMAVGPGLHEPHVEDRLNSPRAGAAPRVTTARQ